MSSWKKRISLAFGMYSAIAIVAFTAFALAYRDAAAATEEAILEPLITVATFSFLATFLSYRRPENRISWLLVAVAFLQYLRLSSITAEILMVQGTLPTPGLLLWHNLFQLMAGSIYSLLAYLFVLFPDGRLPSPRFRLATWALAFMWLVSTAMVAFLAYDAHVAFASAATTGIPVKLVPLAGRGKVMAVRHVRPIPEMGTLTAFALIPAAMSVILFGLISQVTRFRRGSTLERQQIKWVIFVLAVWLLALVPFFSIPEISPLMVAVLLPLLSSGIAVPILRYRLYDIDIIIRRTLVFGVLTGLLLLVYFGAVAVMQWALVWFVGGDSPAIIVLATLLSAALFMPLRRRIQGFIDRRFYRRKYDAQRVLARFADTVQHEVEMEQVTSELVHLIDLTLQPETVLLWIKDKGT